MCDVFPSQHVTAEGNALVKHTEDAASNKKVCSFPKKIVCDILWSYEIIHNKSTSRDKKAACTVSLLWFVHLLIGMLDQ